MLLLLPPVFESARKQPKKKGKPRAISAALNCAKVVLRHQSEAERVQWTRLSARTPGGVTIAIALRYRCVLIFIITIILIPTAPRIPPHLPPRVDKGGGVVSLFGYLLS